MRLSEPRQDRRQALGRQGEDEAEQVLRRAGLEIVERRFRRRLGEIDVIAVQGDVVVFVEVKTRSGRSLGRPSEAVNAAKRRRIARVALRFLQERGWLDRPCRFDVVEVLSEAGEGVSVNHIHDAFRLGPDGS